METRNGKKVEFTVTQTFGGADQLCNEVWELNHRIDRFKGPAIRSWSETTGFLRRELWYRNGNPHREGAPSLVQYDEHIENSKTYEEWRINGALHRLDGPARLWYDPQTGVAQKQEFWVKGRRVQPSGINLKQ